MSRKRNPDADPVKSKRSSRSVAKGKTGERDVAKRLNDALKPIYEARHIPWDDSCPQVQRNQNQSAVGGDDLVGTFNFSIEVKNHATPAPNVYWKQALASAARTGKQPVVIYKIPRVGWRVIMGGGIKHEAGGGLPGLWMPVGRLEISLDDFVELFADVARHSM